MKNRTCLPLIQTWSEWGQIFTDITVWQPAIKRICQEQELAPVVEIVAGYPGTCAVFVINQTVVVKIYPPLLPHDYERELEVYQVVTLPQMPRLLAKGIYHDQCDWPYLVLTFCSGQPIRELFAQITPANRLTLAQELGQLLRTLHQTPLLKLKAFAVAVTDWQKRMDQYAENNLIQLRQTGIVSTETVAKWEKLLYAWEERPFQLCLINADLTEDHLLLVQAAGHWHISALIDWADAEVSTPAYEWVALWFGLCHQDTAMFREVLHSYDPTLTLDDTFRQQMLVYTLRHRFGASILEAAWQKDTHIMDGLR